jgi:hypothetical protein
VYVIANMWFDDLLFQVHEPGPWVQVVCTAGRAPSPIGGSVTVAARSIVVLVRDRRA